MRPLPEELVPIELPRTGPELGLLQVSVRCTAQGLELSRRLELERS